VTVVKLEIEKCASDYLPQGGSNDNTTTIRAFVTPSTVEGKFKFTLFDVSDEKGYCLNAPTNLPASGEDSDSWKDFQFPSQTGFTISGSDSNIAETVASDLNEATVTIKSFDYGSFGKIKAEFTKQDYSFTCIAKETGGINEYTRLPADSNSNSIADSWSGDAGPSGNSDATYDDDNSPTNGYTTGDGLSRYEEYRGFNVNGNHVRTIPTIKDVFICDVGNAFGSSRDDVGQLGCDTHWIQSNEWDGASSDESPTLQHINFNCESHRGRTYLQRALRIIDGGNDGTSTWGMALHYLPRCPNNTIMAVVYTGNINAYWTNSPPSSEVITRTVAHELAHGCGLLDDYSNPGGIMSEYLEPGSNVWHIFRSGTGEGTLNELRIRYP
jgi:predicted Zn-dependent protease with MMP-like domain